MSGAPPLLPPAAIQLGSTLAETGRMHDWLDVVFGGSPVPAATAHAIRLCLEEAVMNVIMHGYGVGQPGAIEVALWSMPHRVLARVTDEAAEYDPTRPVAGPAAPSSLSIPGLAALGGRGLGLIGRYSDKRCYQRLDGRNRLTLEFAVPAPAGPSPRQQQE